MGLKMKNFNIMGVHWKSQFLGMEGGGGGGGFAEKQYIGRGLGEREGVVLLRGVDIPMHTML